MRNPQRLDAFYEAVKKIHKESFPDWRFGQLFFNFWRWLSNEKHIDIFFPEEDETIKLLKEYVKWSEGF